MSLRYPVGPTGTKEEFERSWYVATPFGEKTDYGYHEALDINLRTGGNTDLGQNLYSIAKGRIVYYHDKKHPTKNFGRHMVVKINTPLGSRWVHYAHCQEITPQEKDVERGDVIGKLGNSGTEFAHLHLAVFKVDPSTLPNGIDTIAKTKDQLDAWWEDPFTTLESVGEEPNTGVPQWLVTLLQERSLTIENEPEIRGVFNDAKKYQDEVPSLKEKLATTNEDLADKTLEVAELTKKNNTLTADRDTFEKDLIKTRSEREDAKFALGLAQSTIEDQNKKIETLNARVLKLESDNSLYAYSWTERFASLFRKK